MAAGRRSILGGLAAGIGLGAASSRAYPAAVAGGRAASVATNEHVAPLVIGALFPLTGPLAAQGNECLRGVHLAVELCNAGGGLLGRPVSLVTADATDPDRAVAEARKLIADKQPNLIFGTGASALSLGASEVSEGSGVPYWELTATLPLITGRSFQYLLRVCETAADTAESAVTALDTLIAPALRTAASTLPVAFLYSDDASGSALQELVQGAAQRHHLPVPMSIAYQPGKVDFDALASRLAELRPTVLMHFGSADDVVLLHTALASRAWRPQSLVGLSPAYGSAETAAMIDGGLEGVIAVGVVPFGVAAQLAPNAAMVETLYAQRFGAAPRSGFSLSHFAGASLCFDVLRLARSADKDKVLGVVRTLGLPQGTLANGWGALFSPDGQNRRAFTTIAQWQGSKLQTLRPTAGAVARLRL